MSLLVTPGIPPMNLEIFYVKSNIPAHVYSALSHSRAGIYTYRRKVLFSRGNDFSNPDLVYDPSL